MPLTDFRSTDTSSSLQPNQNSPFKSLSSLGGLSSFKDNIGKPDLNSSAGLLNFANQQGGQIAQTANEIAHPTTGILSTISDGFKNSFQEFLKVISIPSNIVAGAIDPNKTIGQAIDTNERVSDVLFGQQDPNASTMSKVGQFFTRTAVDILTDPLTYLTFGAGEGIFGLRATSKITLEGAGATAAGVAEGTAKHLNLVGQDLYKTLKPLEQVFKAGDLQKSGTAMSEFLKTADETSGQAGQILKDLLNNTLDLSPNSKQAIDWTKKAMSNLFTKSPQLTETFLDKGGIKLFGKTILEGAKIHNAIVMIPGMTTIDHFTAPVRGAVQALFDPALIKVNGNYVRLPEEFLNLRSTAMDFGKTAQEGAVGDLFNISKSHNLTGPESDFLRAAVESKKLPADPRLAKAYLDMMGVDSKQFAALKAAGVPVSYLDQHVMPHVSATDEVPVRDIPFKTPPSISTPATKQAGLVKFIEQGGVGFKPTGVSKTTALLANMSPEERALSQRALDIAKKYPDEAGNASGFGPAIKEFMDSMPQESRDRIMASIRKTTDSSAEEGQIISDYTNKLKEIFNNVTKPSVEAVKTSGEAVLESLPKEITSLKNIDGGTGLIGKIAGAGSVQEARFAVSDHINQLLADMTSGPAASTFEDAFSHPDVKELLKLQDSMDTLPQAKQLVGSAENLGLKQEGNDMNIFKDTNGQTYKRMAATLDELKKVGFEGFDTNFFRSHLSRSLSNAKAITMTGFLQDSARSFGKVASEAPKGYVPIDSSAMKGAIADVFGQLTSKDGEQVLFHPAIAEAIKNFTGAVINDEPTKDVLKMFDKMQNVWKASVTSIFPAFHGRNAISNVLLHFMDLGVHSFNPVVHSQAASILYHDLQANSLLKASMGVGEKALKAKDDLGELLGKTMFNDSTGHAWTFGELRQVVKDTGVALNTNLVGSLDIAKTPQELADAFTKGETKVGSVVQKANPLSQSFVPFAAGREAGRLIENQARLVDFIANLKNTGDVQLAAARTKQFLFDYGNLTNFEKTFARRLIPFYTFTRKNIEMQVRSLMTTPGRVSAEISAIQNIGDLMSGNLQLNDQEKAALPDWVKQGLQIVTAKSGGNVSILQGFGTPIEQPFQALQPNQVLGSLSPLIRVPIEQATGYSLFQGKPLSQVTNATAFTHAPDFIKNMIGYTEVNSTDSTGKKITYAVSLRPNMMNLFLNLPPTSRVFSAMKQLQTADVATQDKLMQQLIGARPYTFNLSTEAQRRENELKQKLQDLLTSAHVTATFKRTFLPSK